MDTTMFVQSNNGLAWQVVSIASGVNTLLVAALPTKAQGNLLAFVPIVPQQQ
jgi:hypothetical protein